MEINKFVKILKFGTTGLIGFFADFTVTYSLKEMLHWNGYLSNVIGICIAIIIIFLLHKNWTFVESENKGSKSFMLFLAISLTGCLLNTGIVFFLQVQLFISFYLAKMLAISIVSVWNFLLNKNFAFKRASKQKLPQIKIF